MESEAGAECLLRMWHNYSSEEFTQGLYCNATWDGTYCWPPIPAGKEVTKLCSEVAHDLDPHNAAHIKGYATRVCLDDGEWKGGNKTNYEECKESFENYYEKKNDSWSVVEYMMFVGSIISLLSLGISLAIFYRFRCLWSDQLKVRAHLMIALVIRCFFQFLIFAPLVLAKPDNYLTKSTPCKLLWISCMFATAACMKWMFVQGLYLTITLMPRIFTRHSRDYFVIYLIIGWIVPVVMTIVYGIALHLHGEQEKCWSGFLKMKEMWILEAPIIFALVMNGLFLLNILRIQCAQIQNSHSRANTSQFRAAAKSLALLFPVLGINYLLMLLYNPEGHYNKYFVFLCTFFESFQGIFVAIVYCFVDKEVYGAIKRSYRRYTARREVAANLMNNVNVQMVEIANHDGAESSEAEEAI